MANRIQPHFRSQSKVATSPGGRVPPGPNHHSLSESPSADSALVRPMRAAVCDEGGGWLALGSLSSPLPWHADVMCPAHLACLAHQK